jgi:hypothetical protein
MGNDRHQMRIDFWFVSREIVVNELEPEVTEGNNNSKKLEKFKTP